MRAVERTARWRPRPFGWVSAAAGRLSGSLAVLLVSAALLLPGTAARAQVASPEHLREMMGWGRASLILADELEYAPGVDGRPLSYDVLGWTGGESRRIWAKAKGEHATRDGHGHTELQLLYGQLVSPWWDAQLGVMMDARYGEGSSRTRASLSVGVQGLAPGWFDVEPTLFVSQDGDVSARLRASYDLLFTQRLVVQPEMGATLAIQEVPEFGVGRGLNGLELGVRMRYEIRREVAPYVGLAWSNSFAGAADLARGAGEPVRDLRFVAGVRLWR